MMMQILFSLVCGAVAAWVASYGVMLIMERLGCVDKQGSLWRKIHKKDIPLGGGVAIAIGVFVVISAGLLLGVVSWPDLFSAHIPAIFGGAALLLIGGFLDDKYNLAPWLQILSPCAAVLLVIASGVIPKSITNMFTGESADFSPVFGMAQAIPVALTFFWLVITTFATKVIDGVDGLVGSILTIGGVLLGVSSFVQDKPLIITFFAFSLVASGLGFLWWNWHPASLFLGEGGSTLAGFLLGVVAILAESKFAVAFFVLALPLLDMIRVVWVRVSRGQPIFRGDTEHLHHHLLKSGFSHMQIVYFFCGLSLLSGLIALRMQRSDWLYVFALSFVFIFFASFWLSETKRRA